MRHTRQWARVLGTVILLSLTTPMPPAGAQAQDLELVGRLSAQAPRNETTSADGGLIVNPTKRTLYQVFDVNFLIEKTKVRIIDLDTLAPLRTVTLPYSLAPADPANVALPHALDEQNDRLFLPYYRRDLSGTAAGALSGLAGVVIVNGATGEVTDQPSAPALLASGIAWPLGASWSPQEQRLYILGRTVLPKPGGSDTERNLVQPGGLAGLPSTVVVRWNPNKPAQLAQSDPLGFADAVRPVRACRRGLHMELDFGKFQATILSSALEPSVWVTCGTASLGFQIIRLDRNQLADPSGAEDVFPGPEKIRSSLADVASERILARYVSGGEVWWVFDTQRRAWVGRVGATQTATGDVSAGIDQGTGRLYLHYPSAGLLRADARRGEVPQADAFPDITSKGPFQPIVIDPPTRRIFLRAAPDHFDIYRDARPVPEPPEANPDSRTTDVEEEESQTGAGFSGVARAYGTRTMLIGGAWGLVPPDQFGANRGLLIEAGSGCGPREREVAVGLVEESTLANSQASARVHALRTDDATKQDLGNPSRCDLGPRGPTLNPQIIRDWYPGLGAFPDPSQPQGEESNLAQYLDREATSTVDPETLLVSVDCSGDDGTKRTTPRQPAEGERTGGGPAPLEQALREERVHDLEAEARCEQERARAGGRGGGPAFQIEATTSPAGELPEVNVARAFSETSLFRDPARGAVAQAYAIARGIDIGETPTGPLISIDAVESWADASANGRKKSEAREDTATGRFVRRLSGVTVRAPDGRVVFACQDCSRDVLTAQQQMNTALAGRAEVRVPMPDPRLISGTPGGYQAAVQKDEFQIRADTALNNDPSFQVPGLEIVATNDDPNLRARQIVQLAGVAAASSYGIFLLGADFGPPTTAPEDPFPPGSEVTASLGEDTVVSEAPMGDPPSLGPDRGTLSDLAREVVQQAARAASLIVRNPLEGLLAAAVWLAFAAPLYAFARRRLLVRSLTSRR